MVCYNKKIVIATLNNILNEEFTKNMNDHFHTEN